jgi:hypothetical protein
MRLGIGAHTALLEASQEGSTMTRSIGALALMLVLLAGCSGSGVTVTPTPTELPAPTAVGPATVEPTSSDGEPSPGDEPVDLVVVAASGGEGVSERYAPLLAAALGREVRTHSKIGSRPTELMSGSAGFDADIVAGAEVILFYFPPAGHEPPEFLTCLEALDAVTDPDYPGGTLAPGQTWDPPPAATTAEDWQAWRDALDREYEAMWALREGQPTIIRGYGGWNAWIPAWRRAGVEAACTAGEEAYDQVMREAAEAAGAAYVSMLDVFTGPTHDQDPGEQGWIADDGMHLSDAGKDVLVEALAAAGFEESEPPR